MRLFDKALAQSHQFRDPMLKRAGEITVIAADVIAEHYATLEVSGMTNEDYPYATPPWDSFFIEWNFPRVWNLQGEMKPIQLPWQQQGIWGDACPCDPETLRQTATILEFTAEQQADIALVGRHCAVSVVAVMVTCYAGQVISSAPCLWLIDGEGVVRFRNCPPTVPWETARHFDAASEIAHLTCTFANSNRVKLQDVTDAIQPEAKVRRRLKLPDVRRYTLNIRGHYVIPGRNHDDSPKGLMPFHLCRGHFATYTAERPMFGNPKLVGRFWHPPHMKGKKENGEVVKDYAIAAEAGT